MVKNVPAKIYPPFSDFFSEEVTKVQKDVDYARAFEPVYIAIREALNVTANDYPQKFTISRYGNALYVRASILSNQHYNLFQPLVDKFASEMIRLKVRDHDVEMPKPMKAEGVSWMFRVKIGKDTNLTAYIQLNVPYGTENIYRSVTKTPVTYSDIRCDYSWLDSPTAPQSKFDTPEYTKTTWSVHGFLNKDIII